MRAGLRLLFLACCLSPIRATFGQEKTDSNNEAIVSDWLENLLRFDDNREKYGKRYAVVIETDFAGDRKSFNGNTLMYNRRFLLSKIGDDEVYFSTRFDVGEDVNRIGWIEIDATLQGQKFFFAGGRADLQRLKKLPENNVAGFIRQPSHKFADPTLLPIATVPWMCTGRVNASLMDALIKQEGFVLKESKHGIANYRYGDSSELQQVSFDDKQGGLPVETVTKLTQQKPNCKWEEAELYSYVKSDWKRVDNVWYPKEMATKFYGWVNTNDPDRDEWTEIWRFTWLDVDRVAEHLDVKNIAKTVSVLPMNPEMFSKLKEFEIR